MACKTIPLVGHWCTNIIEAEFMESFNKSIMFVRKVRATIILPSHNLKITWSFMIYFILFYFWFEVQSGRFAKLILSSKRRNSSYIG